MHLPSCRAHHRRFLLAWRGFQQRLSFVTLRLLLAAVSIRQSQEGKRPDCVMVPCSQLKTVAPAHLSIKRLEGAEEAFDRAAATFVAA